jgi:hypothetical protein
MRAIAATGVCLSLLFLSGCEAPAWLALFPNPFKAPEARPSGAPSPVPRLTIAEVENARKRARAELLREMMLVVYMRPPKDVGEFNSYMNVLQQGASFEGLYNGFTHSSDFRVLEASNKGATPAALSVFGQELAALEADLPQPTEFTAASAQPLARPVMPEAGPDHPQISPKPVKVLTADAYSQLFVGASIFTLKRVLGDEALKVVGSKRDFTGKLALWYSKWVVRIAERGVDFGIPARNRADEAFHYNWALTATEDQLEWEVLNRVHRVLNAANKKP